MSWDSIDLSKIGERPKVKPTIGSAGLLYPGKRHLLSGEPESAKTLYAYIVALEAIRAEGKVCLLDFEMGQWDARDRLRELGATDEELTLVDYREPEEPATAEHIGSVIDGAPTLVLIDAAAGAYDAEGLDDNKRKDAEAWSRAWIRPLWHAGIATIVIDHVVKDPGSRGNYAIGSERKVGGVDVHLGFETITAIRRGGTGLYKITTRRDRPGHLPRPRAGELELVSDPDTHAITWTHNPPAAEEDESGDGFRPTILMDRVLEHFGRYPEPASRTTIADLVIGKRQWTYRAIECLLQDGRLVQVGKKIVPSSRNVPGTVPPDEIGNDSSLVPSLYRGN